VSGRGISKESCRSSRCGDASAARRTWWSRTHTYANTPLSCPDDDETKQRGEAAEKKKNTTITAGSFDKQVAHKMGGFVEDIVFDTRDTYPVDALAPGATGCGESAGRRSEATPPVHGA
jgi:hypothetical protein